MDANEKVEINGHLIHETQEPYENEYVENNPYFCERCNSRFYRLDKLPKCTHKYIGTNLA